MKVRRGETIERAADMDRRAYRVLDANGDHLCVVFYSLKEREIVDTIEGIPPNLREVEAQCAEDVATSRDVGWR